MCDRCDNVAKEFGFYPGVNVRDENQPLNYIEGDKNKTNKEKPFSKKSFPDQYHCCLKPCNSQCSPSKQRLV